MTIYLQARGLLEAGDENGAWALAQTDDISCSRKAWLAGAYRGVANEKACLAAYANARLDD